MNAYINHLMQHKYINMNRITLDSIRLNYIGWMDEDETNLESGQISRCDHRFFRYFTTENNLKKS